MKKKLISMILVVMILTATILTAIPTASAATLETPSFTLSNTATGVKIAWDKVSDAAQYRVFYKKNGSWTKITDTTSTSYTHTAIKSGNSYTYTVRCLSENGKTYTSGYHSGKSIKYVAAPKLSLSQASKGINISWAKVSGASKYRVYVKKNGSWTKIATTTSTNYLYTDVKAGSSYTFTIRCVNSAATAFESYYNTTGWTIKRLANPTLSLSQAAKGINLSWSKVSGASKYRVYVKKNGSWTKIATTTSTNYLYTDVKAGSSYTFTIRCVNSAATAFESYYNTTGWTIKRLANPTLSLSNESTSGIRIKWSKVSGASKYRVYVKKNGTWTKIADTTSTSYLYTDVTKGTKYTFTIRCINSAATAFESYYNTTGWTITRTDKTWHDAEYEYINHPAETKKVWVVDKKQIVNRYPLYYVYYGSVCFDCGKDISEFTCDGFNCGHDYNSEYDRSICHEAHCLYHIFVEGMSGSWGSGVILYDYYTGEKITDPDTVLYWSRAFWSEEHPEAWEGYNALNDVLYRETIIPEEGHWETKVVKKAWTEKKLVRKAGWY